MDCVLNINKPSGMTSHDVVRKVRGILKEKRIGHTGTLDPMATGVLVLCVGRATRIARYLEAGEKEYRAVMRLGITTDTLDADGRILQTTLYTPPDRTDLLRVLEGFTGVITQRPPAFSALKVSGVPSYKLAREGKAEPLKERQVTVFSLELSAYEDPLATFSVRCSKGTYIRTLCADIGAVLGMGAHLTGLARTHSGRFSLDHAVDLDRLAELAETGALAEAMVSMDEALADLPVFVVSEAEAVRISHGNRVSRREGPETTPEARVRVHDPGGSLLAIATAALTELIPEVVFS